MSLFTPFGPQTKSRAYVCALALLSAVAGGVLFLSSKVAGPLSPSPNSSARNSKLETRNSKQESRNSKLESRNAKLENGKAKPDALRPSQADPAARARLVKGYGRLPLRFEANSGQTDARVKFLSRGRGYTMFLTADEAVLSLRSQDSGVRNQNGKMETGNWKLETGKSKLETRHPGAGDSKSGSLHSPSLLPSPESLLAGTTHKQQPTTHGLPFTNLQSSIFNSPAPSTQNPAPSVVRMKLAGANPKAKVSGLKELPGKSNYFIGNDPKKWRTNVPNYAEVKYEGVYPGIDLIYYGTEGGQLEYDFVVAPGADPSIIAFDIVGAGPRARPGAADGQPRGVAPTEGVQQGAPLRIDAHGDLVIPTDAGEVRFHKPVVYQPVAPPFRAAPVAAVYERRTAMGTSPLQPNPKSQIENPKFPGPGSSNPQSPIDNRQSVDGRFVLLAENRIGFEVPNYDKTKPLVIDPVLSYSTYLGGTGDESLSGIAVDSAGNAYLTGTTTSTDFPTSSPLQAANAGTIDVFVTKLNPSGSALVYSTYLGGSNPEITPVSIAVDNAGNAYITGTTTSTDFPTSSPLQAANAGAIDIFVAKLNPSGSTLTYSTYLGGTFIDRSGNIAVDGSGNVYVTGNTASSDFPTSSPVQGANAGAIDVFVTKLNPAGSALSYSTYLGGEGTDFGSDIAVDGSGNSYVGGRTTSAGFPTVNPFQEIFGGIEDGFVAKLNPAGSALGYSTYLGGSGNEGVTVIAVDSTGNVYVAGSTVSADFPTMDPIQPEFAGGTCSFGLITFTCADAFVSKLNPAGAALVYSTYLGGSGSDGGIGIALDGTGSVFVAGGTTSTDFPTMNPIQPTFSGGICGVDPNFFVCVDTFITKIDAAGLDLVYSTYLGGSGTDGGIGIALDGSGHVYVGGSTDSADFPTANPLQPAFAGGILDAFITRISPGRTIMVSPASLTFGNQIVGSTSAAQTVTVTNTGEAPVTFASIAASGDFGVDGASTTCVAATPLAVGLGCNVGVEFAPTVAGTRNGSLTITSDALSSPDSVALTGNATNSSFNVQPGGSTSATVTAGQSTTFKLQIEATPGVTGTATLGCLESIVDATCSVFPGTATLNAADPFEFNVSLLTAARSAGTAPTLPPGAGPGPPTSLPTTWVWVVAAVMMLGTLAASRRRARVALLAAMLFVVVWSSCVGNSEVTRSVARGGTPSGIYTVVVTGTLGGVTKTQNLTVTVN